MAFTAANFYNVPGMPPGYGVYIYKSDTDARETVMASGYFNNIDDMQNLAADDLIIVTGDKGGYILRVDTVTAATGVVTTELGGNSVWLTVKIPDVSTADSVWLVAPFDGLITRIKTVISGAIATADAVVGIELGGTDVTGGQVTIANSGSAAGDTDSSDCTAANVVAEGDAIEIDTNGASTNTVECVVQIEITPA